MLEERKKSSIPNSVVSQTNVLFNHEDLANDSQQQKINRAGPITFRGGYGKSGMGFRFRPGFRYSFRGSSTSSNFRFGAGRFGAKGKGKSNSTNCLEQGISPTSIQGINPTPFRAISANYARTITVKPIKFTPFSEFKKTFGMVEVTFKPRNLSIDSIWNPTPMGLPTSVVKDNNKKVRFGIGKSKIHFGRVSQGGCSKTLHRFKKHWPFCALVCSVKDRKQQRKTQINLRLQRNKSIFSNKNFQIGPHSNHFPLFKEKHVGSQNRLKGCLFPFGIRQPIEKIYETPSWRSNLGIPRGVFWPKHYAKHFHDNNEDIREKMETKRYTSIHLFGRYFGNCPHKRHFGLHMKRVVQDLLLGGFKINLKKSQLEASQMV
jgi:hypothetical protein